MPIILATQEAEIRKDQGSKPAWANRVVSKTLSQKKKSQKTAGGVAQGVGPEFKPQYCKKKKNHICQMNKQT
jgi:hypothetical protein